MDRAGVMEQSADCVLGPGKTEGMGADEFDPREKPREALSEACA